MSVIPPRERNLATRERHLKALRAFGETPDIAFDLIEAGLHLAALEKPDSNLDFYRDHVARLIEDTGTLVAEGRSPSDSLRRSISGLHGYRGDAETYDDPQNASLIRVIDRRRGLPVALGILYIEAARAQGWQMDGLNFPGHFLLRLETEDGERLVLDPFHELRALEAVDLRQLLKRTLGGQAELAPGHYAPVSDRSVLLRLHNNLKARLVRQGETVRALEALGEMIAFAPDDALLWHEVGVLSARLGRLVDAVTALEQALQMNAPDIIRQRASELLADLKTRIH